MQIDFIEIPTVLTGVTPADVGSATRIIIAYFDCHYREYFYISTHDMPLLLPYSFIQQQCNKCC